MTKIRSIIARIVQATADTAKNLIRFASNSGALITVATYAKNLGLSAEWMKKWGSALGRLVAKTYRKSTGTEPLTRWESTDRGVKRHMAYPTDSTALRIAIASYINKTAPEVA